jgi:hypothetical protein
MSGDETLVFIEGEQPTKAPDRRTVAEINAEADRLAAETARHRQEAAYWRQQSAETLRGQIEMNHSLLATEREAAEAQLRQALEYADADRMIAAQRALTQLDARQAQNERAWHQANSRPADPVEQYVQGRSDRDAAWLRAHPEFICDARKNAKLQAAHSDALAEGHDPTSAGYLEHVERFVGLRGASEGDGVASPRARGEARSSEPRRGKITIKLSREDHARLRDTAESLGMPFETYLARYVQMRDDPTWNWRVNDGASS